MPSPRPSPAPIPRQKSPTSDNVLPFLATSREDTASISGVSEGGVTSDQRIEDLEDRILVRDFLESRGEERFRVLYRRHSPILGRTIYRILRGDSDDTAEVLQITWIRAVERLDQFEWRSSLRSWLTGIALNCSREHLRQRKRTSSDPIELHEPVEPPRVLRRLDRVDLEKAIDSLPNGYRQVLVLHDIEGYTHQEIGGLLGIEAGTSKSQLSRARKAMRVWLHREDAE